MGERRLLAKARRKIKMWMPEERWCCGGGRAGTRRGSKEEARGAAPVPGCERALAGESPVCRQRSSRGHCPKDSLEPGFDASKCWISVFAFYSLGSSCHPRFKFLHVMSDITKVTSYADRFALGTRGVFGVEKERHRPEARRAVRGEVLVWNSGHGVPAGLRVLPSRGGPVSEPGEILCNKMQLHIE